MPTNNSGKSLKNKNRSNVIEKTQTKDKEKQRPFCCCGNHCKIIDAGEFGGAAADSDERRLDLDSSYTAHCQTCKGYFHSVSCGNAAQTCCNVCDSSDNVDVTAGDDGREIGK
jgi:hypothetical protein